MQNTILPGKLGRSQKLRKLLGQTRRAAFEPLEARRLLAAQMVYADALVYDGTAANVSVNVFYDVSDARNDLSGLTARVHYNSKALVWDGNWGSDLATGQVGKSAAAVDDTVDFDGTAATDKYVEISWSDPGKWSGADLPQKLFTLGFAPVASELASGPAQINLSGIPSAGYDLSAVNSTVVIPQVSMNAATLLEGQAGVSKAAFELSIPAAVAGDITVKWETKDQTADATDYTVASGEATIKAGQTTATISVDILGDTTVEPTETFLMNLTSATNATLKTTSAVGSIVNDDLSMLKITGPGTFKEGDAGTTDVTFTFTLDQAPLSPVVVNYKTVDGTADSSDYKSASGTVTLEAGKLSADVTVSVLTDRNVEADETFDMTASAVGVSFDGKPVTATIQNDDGFRLSLASATVAKAEGDSGSANVTVTVNLSEAAPSDITVDYATSAGTATEDGDYTKTAGTLKIAAGSTQGTIDIPLIGDTTVEADETFTLDLTNPVGAIIEGGSSATITITNDDGDPSVNLAPVTKTVAEDAGTVEFEVTLAYASDFPVTVNYSTKDGTALGGSDYVTVTDSVVIPAGDLSAKFTVTVTDDKTAEASENFQVALVGAKSAVLGSDVTSTITVTDNDCVVSVGDAKQDEGSGTMVVPVTLNQASEADVTVAYSFADAGAVAGEDYTATAGKLTIPAGKLSGDITFTITDDKRKESAEAVKITLSSPENATIGTGEALATITDNDLAPTIDIASKVSVSEGAGSVAVDVTLSNPSDETVTVNYISKNGTAESGVDYVAVGGTLGTLTIAPGAMGGQITFKILEDGLREGDETVLVNLFGPVNGVLGTTASTVTITDNEVDPVVSVAATASALEGAGKAELEVKLSNPTSSDVTVDYATSDGTALDGTHYVASKGTLTIPAGQVSGKIIVSTFDDKVAEADTQLGVTLTNVSANATLGNDKSVVTLTDDDSPTISISPVTNPVGEADGKTTFTVTLSNLSALPVSVDYGVTGGSATVAADYAALAGTLTIPAGQLVGSFSLDILEDNLHEGDETVVVSLSNAVNGTLGAAASTTAIADNDPAPTISIASTASAAENAGKIDLQVSLSNPSSTDVSVDYAIADGTAILGKDYTATSGTLVISAGSTSGVVTLTLLDDTTFEADDTVLVTLSNPVGGSLGNATATATITNDDATPTVSIAPTASVAETDGKLAVDVTLSNLSAFDVSVDYVFVDKTAVLGKDYTGIGGTLVIPAGQATGQITLGVVDDGIGEAAETLEVTLSNPVNGTLGTATSVVTITDNDTPTIAIVPTATVLESAGTVTLDVTLSNASDLDVSVDYAFADGTALLGKDYAATKGTLTIAAGQTTGQVTFDVLEDTIREADETLAVTLSNPVNAVLANATSAATITDNDPEPTISVAPTLSVQENAGSVNLEVTLSNPSDFAVSIDYVFADDTAVLGSDYAATAGTLVIPAGQTTGQIAITVLDNNIREADETLLVTLSNPGNGSLGAAATTVTIVDNDEPVISIVPTLTVAEDADKVNLQVSLSNPSEFDVSVDYSFADAGATLDVDYKALAGTLVIPAGQTTGQVSITVLEDIRYEFAESVTVTLANPVNGTIGNATSTLTITDNDAQPTATVTPATLLVTEPRTTGDWNATLNIVLSNPSDEVVTINYTVADGTALVNFDYLPGSGSVVFAVGETSKTLDIPVLADTITEGDETFTVALSAVNGTVDPAGLNVTIRDEQPLGQIDAKDSSGMIFATDANGDFCQIGSDGSYLAFDLDFGQGRYNAIRMVLASSSQTGVIEAHVLNPAGPTIGTLNVQYTGTMHTSQQQYLPLNAVLTGQQRVWLVARGLNTSRLSDIALTYVAPQAATAPVDATIPFDSKGVGHFDVLSYTDAGDYAAYRLTDPTWAFDTLVMDISSTNGGRFIQIYADRLNDPTALVGELVIAPGVSWQAFSQQAASVNLAGLTPGEHTFYLAFRGGEGVANVRTLQFETRGLRNAAVGVQAETFDSQVGVVRTPSAIAWVDTGDSVTYNGVNFGAGQNTFVARLAVENQNSQGQIDLKLADGTLIGTLNVAGTDSYMRYAEQAVTLNQTVTGLQDLTLSFRGGEGIANVDSFRFETRAASPAAGPIVPSDFVDQSGLATGPAFTETSAGDWARANVNFGAGAARAQLKLAAVASTGQVRIWLDGLNQTLVGTLNVASTGSWDNYVVEGVNLNRVVTGIHPVFIEFQGTGGVANVQWMQFV